MSKISGLKNVEVSVSVIEKNVCDVCGEDATNWAFDLTKQSIDKITIEYRKRGLPKFGCNKHRSITNVYSVDGFFIETME